MTSSFSPSPPTALRDILRRSPNLRHFLAIRIAFALASQMLNIAIGWAIYDATRSPLDLGYVGLAQFLPNLLFGLFAGQAADRLDRRRILAICLAVQTGCAATFLALSWSHSSALWPIYGLLLLFGSARAFAGPTMAVLLPNLVDEVDFPRAVALGSSSFQVATIAGPALAGVIYGWNQQALLLGITLLIGVACLQTFSLNILAKPRPGDGTALSGDRSLLAGLRYVRANRLILGAISLDMVAVLLGGVTALLPIFARDILLVGPQGLGILRSAPGLGAAMVGLWLARHPIRGRAGALMLCCVAGYGAATVLFALSREFWLSLGALVVLGAFDMVSVVIRQTLVQLATPDAMRGRVSAVNFIFIGVSNQLGEFESGATAAILGTIPAALCGGLGTLLVVLLWGWGFPELRRIDRISTKLIKT